MASQKRVNYRAQKESNNNQSRPNANTVILAKKCKRSCTNSSEGKQIYTLRACIPQSTLTKSCYENMIYQAWGILHSDTAKFHLQSLSNLS